MLFLIFCETYLHDGVCIFNFNESLNAIWVARWP
jgi:hypothetical protein